jgi:hypothetical protein
MQLEKKVGFAKKCYPVSKRVRWKDLKIGDWVQMRWSDTPSLLISGFRDSGIDGMRPHIHGFTFDPRDIVGVSRHI